MTARPRSTHFPQPYIFPKPHYHFLLVAHAVHALLLDDDKEGGGGGLPFMLLHFHLLCCLEGGGEGQGDLVLLLRDHDEGGLVSIFSRIKVLHVEYHKKCLGFGGDDQTVNTYLTIPLRYVNHGMYASTITYFTQSLLHC